MFPKLVGAIGALNTMRAFHDYAKKCYRGPCIGGGGQIVIFL
jgi:hypothetical protein